jgi:hypothetical protein
MNDTTWTTTRSLISILLWIKVDSVVSQRYNVTLINAYTHWDRYMSRRFHDHKQKDDMINRVRKFGIATSQRRLPTMINGQVTKHYLHIVTCGNTYLDLGTMNDTTWTTTRSLISILLWIKVDSVVSQRYSRRFHDHKQKDDMINRVRKFGIATSQRRLPTMINGQVTKHYLHIERRKWQFPTIV